jgi:hypothetical protein
MNIYSIFYTVEELLSLNAVKETVYLPGVSYTTVGFCSVDIAGVPTSKVQFYLQ